MHVYSAWVSRRHYPTIKHAKNIIRRLGLKTRFRLREPVVCEDAYVFRQRKRQPIEWRHYFVQDGVYLTAYCDDKVVANIRDAFG